LSTEKVETQVPRSLPSETNLICAGPQKVLTNENIDTKESPKANVPNTVGPAILATIILAAICMICIVTFEP
jgi:hypothetical protein